LLSRGREGEVKRDFKVEADKLKRVEEKRREFCDNSKN